jgi:hypothetical protein
MIDIALVFIYMFLLLSLNKSYLWLPILSFIFVLYTIWDWLSVREYIAKYDENLQVTQYDENSRAPASSSSVLRNYWQGLLDKPKVSRGPIITLSWALFFIVLTAINRWPSRAQVFASSVLAIIALCLYRHDKIIRYTMRNRFLLIVVLLLLAGGYTITRYSKG